MFLPRAFTLHVRLTRDCNAHCSYCSSAGASEGRMSPEDFQKSIDWIATTLFPKLHVGKSHFLTVEYLGGEVLLVPESELEANVHYARQRLRPLVHEVRDGAQSNLIGTPRRVETLAALFENRLGTSWDQRSGQRHIHGSTELYNGLLNRSLSHLEKKRDMKPGRVLVVDSLTAPHLVTEVKDAIEGGYDLVLRPVFQGGSDGIAPASMETLQEAYQAAYTYWRAHAPHHRIDPFSTLYERRKAQVDKDTIQASALAQYCPFQSNCAFKSLSLDPDGSLYICQEMADAGHYPLGNAIKGEFDMAVWKRLAQRTQHLDESCQRCEWKDACGGGCMNEAIEHHGDPFAKTELCPVWKTLFREIDSHLNIKHTHKEIA